MTTLRVYVDATALIGRINRLDLLTLLPCPIRVTTQVWEEVDEAVQPLLEDLLRQA
ncbi:MAG: hypothetical protein M1380_04590 [Chloroflexi bacterium]|nr:hypothetical protein [Chloroflexota bacterium]